MKKTRLDIYSFDDFRDLLKARLKELKEEDPKYSYAYLSKKMGQDNPGRLKMMISGARKLGEEFGEQLAKTLGFTKDQSSYLLKLAAYNQASSSSAKIRALADLRRKKKFKERYAMQLNQFDYLSDPVARTMREMVFLEGFREDEDWISARLPGKVSKEKIRRAIKTLLDLNLLQRNDNGELKAVNNIQFTGHNMESTALKVCYENIFKQSAKALKLPANDRNMGFVTMSCSKDTFEAIRILMDEFRNSVFELVEKDGNCDRVYQLGMSLFPLTEIPEDEDTE